MKPRSRPASSKRRFLSQVPERYLRRLALVAVVLVIGLTIAFRNRLPASDAVAYPAVLILSFVSSAAVIIPVPGILAVCSGGVLLVPVLVGLVAGVAEAAGEITGYLAGFSGRGLVRNNRMYKRVQPWMEHRGWMAVLVFASIPNPTFDVIGIAAGASRMPLWKFLGAAWVGKTTKSIAVAYACNLGYDVFRLLNDVQS